jgi:hypothetical protein
VRLMGLWACTALCTGSLVAVKPTTHATHLVHKHHTSKATPPSQAGSVECSILPYHHHLHLAPLCPCLFSCQAKIESVTCEAAQGVSTLVVVVVMMMLRVCRGRKGRGG